MTKTPPVLVFDGVCNLCHGAVRFILRWEQDSDIVFAPAQSEAGQALMAKYGVSALANDTVFLIDDGQCLMRTDAVLAVAAYLRSPWCHLRHLRVLPRGLRDIFYRLVARYRYAWFGRTTTCDVSAYDRRRLVEGGTAITT